MKRTQTKSQTGVILSSAIYNSSSTLQEIKSLCAQTASVHMAAPSITPAHTASCFLTAPPGGRERKLLKGCSEGIHQITLFEG